MTPATYMLMLSAVSVARQEMAKGQTLVADQTLSGLYNLIAKYAREAGTAVPPQDPISLPTLGGLQ